MALLRPTIASVLVGDLINWSPYRSLLESYSSTARGQLEVNSRSTRGQLEVISRSSRGQLEVSSGAVRVWRSLAGRRTFSSNTSGSKQTLHVPGEPEPLSQKSKVSRAPNLDLCQCKTDFSVASAPGVQLGARFLLLGGTWQELMFSNPKQRRSRSARGCHTWR